MDARVCKDFSQNLFLGNRKKIFSFFWKMENSSQRNGCVLKNMKSKTYICEGYDPLFGPIRDMIKASSYQEAKDKFLTIHGIHALCVDLER